MTLFWILIAAIAAGQVVGMMCGAAWMADWLGRAERERSERGDEARL